MIPPMRLILEESLEKPTQLWKIRIVGRGTDILFELRGHNLDKYIIIGGCLALAGYPIPIIHAQRVSKGRLMAPMSATNDEPLEYRAIGMSGRIYKSALWRVSEYLKQLGVVPTLVSSNLYSRYNGRHRGT